MALSLRPTRFLPMVLPAATNLRVVHGIGRSASLSHRMDRSILRMISAGASGTCVTLRGAELLIRAAAVHIAAHAQRRLECSAQRQSAQGCGHGEVRR